MSIFMVIIPKKWFIRLGGDKHTTFNIIGWRMVNV